MTNTDHTDSPIDGNEISEAIENRINELRRELEEFVTDYIEQSNPDVKDIITAIKMWYVE